MQFSKLTGPKTNTLDDFWRMIWQENVLTSVMLTKLKEGKQVLMFISMQIRLCTVYLK